MSEAVEIRPDPVRVVGLQQDGTMRRAQAARRDCLEAEQPIHRRVGEVSGIDLPRQTESCDLTAQLRYDPIDMDGGAGPRIGCPEVNAEWRTERGGRRLLRDSHEPALCPSTAMRRQHLPKPKLGRQKRRPAGQCVVPGQKKNTGANCFQRCCRSSLPFFAPD